MIEFTVTDEQADSWRLWSDERMRRDPAVSARTQAELQYDIHSRIWCAGLDALEGARQKELEGAIEMLGETSLLFCRLGAKSVSAGVGMSQSFLAVAEQLESISPSECGSSRIGAGVIKSVIELEDRSFASYMTGYHGFRGSASLVGSSNLLDLVFDSRLQDEHSGAHEVIKQEIGKLVHSVFIGLNSLDGSSELSAME